MNIRHLLTSILAIATIGVTVPSGNQLLAAPPEERAGVQAEPLATLTADVTQLTVYGPTSRGVRVDVAFKGKLHGHLKGTMEGVDYSTIRADGVTEVHVHARITTLDKALISVEIQGFLINGQITDTSVKLLTAAPQYAYLHDKMIVGKGTATTETLSIRYFLLQ